MFNASKPEIILNKRIWPQLRRAIAITLCLALLLEQSAFAQVAGQLNLSRFFSPQFSQPSDVNFRPIHLRSVIGNNQQQDLRFLADKGDFATLRINKNITADYEKIVKYFYIGLALPNESFWVNLRPDSPKNLIDPALAFTDAGKILLEADLQLKKDTASYTNPTGVLGKDYWQKLYAKAEELFGNAPQTIPTLVRPWIVPGDIIIVERGDSAYVYKATLKVMLEQDYLKGNAMYKFSDPRQKALNEYSAEIVRKNIIPALTKEINSGKKYAALRQLYYSLILAQWFKQKHYGTNSAYGRLINNRDLTGLCSLEPWSKSEYFKAYKESFQKGEYNIRADAYSLGNMVVRTYFSGGISLIAMIGAQRAGEPVPTARVVRSQPGLPEVVPTYIGSFVGPREGPVLLEGEDQVGAEEGGFPAAGDTAAAVSADSQSRPEGGSWFGNILNRIQAFFKGSLSAEAVDYDDYIQPSEAAEALMDKVEEAVAEVAENPHSTEIFPLQEELRPLLELRHGLTWLRQQALGLNADTHMSDVDITRMFLILASLRKRLEAIKSARATNRGKYSIDKVEELAVRIDQINSAYNLIRAKDSLSIHERRQILKTISAELGDLRQSIEAIEKRLRSSESKISHASTLAIKPDEWLRNYVYVSYYGWLRDYTQGRQSLPDITAQRRKIVDLIIGYIFDANNGYLGDLQDPKIKIQERQELLDSAVEEIINNDVYAIILAELGFDAGSGISEEVENMRRATFAFGGSIIAQTDLNQEGVINPETVIGLMNLAEQWHTALTWLQEKFSAPQLNNNKASWWRRPAPAFSFATFALILITTAILSSMAPASADTLHHPGHGQAMSMLSGDMPQGIVAPDKLIQQLPSSAIAAIFDKPSTAATQPAGVDYSLDPARSHHAPSPAPVSKHIPIYKSPAATQGQPLSTGDSNLDPNHTTAAAQHRVLLPTDANFMADNNGADTVTAITPQADASPLPGLKVADAEEATSGPTPPTLSPAVTSPEPVMAAEALPVILPEVTGQRTTMPQQALLDKPDDKALPAATPTIGPPSTLSPEPPPEAKSVEPQQQPQVISPPHQDSAAVSGPPPGVKAAEPQQPPQIIPSLGSHDSVGAVGPPPQPGNYHHPIAAPPSATVSPPPHQASVATAEPPPEQFLAPQGKSINAYFGGYTVDGGEFGAQRKGYIHHGYDVALEAGTRIPVPMAGRVTEVRYGVAGIGNCITIKLDNGWELQYHHMATNGLAREGDVLRAGQVVGYVAGIEDVPATENGRRFWSGPHVHVQLDNAEHDLVNPARYWPQLVGDQTAAVGAQPGAANGSSTEDIIARVDAVLSPGTQYSGSAEQPPKKDIRIVTPTGFETTASPGEALLPVDDFVPQGFSQKDLEPYYKIIQMGQSHDLKNVDALLKIVKTWDDSKYWNTVTNRNRANFNILGIVTKLLVSPFSGAWDLASGVKTEVSLNSIFDFFRGNRIHRLALK
jgi:hypothetical protein